MLARTISGTPYGPFTEADAIRMRRMLFLIVGVHRTNWARFKLRLVWLFLFWEITTLCSFLLIGYTQTEEAKRNALRALVTPEMLSVFAEQLADQTSRGVRNEARDVSLLQGDLEALVRLAIDTPLLDKARALAVQVRLLTKPAPRPAIPRHTGTKVTPALVTVMVPMPSPCG